MSIPEEPLVCSAASFLVDPVFSDMVSVGHARVDIHNPTADPNRYTVFVPSEKTHLSLGKASGPWKTDGGITGYTNAHVHFEVKKNDKTVVSLGGSAITAIIADGPAPGAGNGYSMVTDGNAWQDSIGQHYLLSQQSDIALTARAAGKRAVVQSDHGIVDLNGGKQVSVSGGGVRFGAKSELEAEDVGYDEPWAGKGPHSLAAGAGKIAVAIAGATAALHNLIVNKVRMKFEPGNFASAKAEWGDKHKRGVNSALFAGSLLGLGLAVAAKNAPPSSVKFDAEKSVGMMAGGWLGFFGILGASLGSAEYATVSSGISAALSGMVFAGVGAALVAVKGFRKVELGSDWGKCFVGAEEEVKLTAKKKFMVSADNTAHVVSLGRKAGKTLLGGAKKTWMGTGKGWGMLLDGDGFAMGKATNAKDMGATKIAKFPAIRLHKESIALQGGAKTEMTLTSKSCSVTSPKIAFEASGAVTVNTTGKIRLK